MDGYVILKSYTASQVILDCWLVPEGLFTDIPEFFGATRAVIESLTDVFQISTSLVTKSNPLLPKILPSGTKLCSFPLSIETLEATFYLYYWEISDVSLPLDAVPGYEKFNYHIRWYYKNTPPSTEQGYLLPYNQEEFDAGDGETYLASTFPATAPSWAQNLMRWFTYTEPLPDGEYVYIFYLPSLYYHYLGGAVDLSDFEFSTSPETPSLHNWHSSTVPPIQPSYTGSNVWNISDEFSAAIEIDSGAMGGGWYYYLNLSGCTLLNRNTALKGSVVEEEPCGAPPTTLLPLALTIFEALHLVKDFFPGLGQFKLTNLGKSQYYGLHDSEYPQSIGGMGEGIRK